MAVEANLLGNALLPQLSCHMHDDDINYSGGTVIRLLVVLHLDFNVPEGPENCVLLVTHATREKEGSNEEPLTDGNEIHVKLKSAGFSFSNSDILPIYSDATESEKYESLACALRQGDHAVASVSLDNANLTHVLVKTKGKGSAPAVDFTLKRLGPHMAAKWIKHEMQLRDAEGNGISPPVISGCALTEEDKAFRRECKVWEAYEGAQKWQWQALTFSGSVLKIDQTTLASFASAPTSIRSALTSVEQEHEKYQNIPEGKLSITDMATAPVETQTSADPRVVKKLVLRCLSCQSLTPLML
eukprot:s826_g33.t1